MNLVRTVLSNVSRINLKRPLHRRTFTSTSFIHHAPSLSFLLPHPADSSHKPPTNLDFPVNIIDCQQSLDTLSSSLQQGELDKARHTLANILDSSPTDGDLQTFQHIIAILAPSGSDNPPVDLILQLGAASSSRGYISFARTEILPLLHKFGTVEVASQFERELLKVGPSRQTVQNVFEDQSDDYTVVSSNANPMQLSPQDLMLQQLPALLPDPLLSDNLSVFENEDETLIEQLSMDPSTHLEKTSIGMLDQILAEQKFEHAYEFLQHLVELDVAIPSHPKYGRVAIALLKKKDELPAERRQECLTWLKLIPAYNEAEKRPMTVKLIVEFMNILLRSIEEDTKMITDTTLALTAKGYSEELSDAVEVIVASLGPEETTTFYQDFEKHEDIFFSNSGFPALSRTVRGTSFRDAFIKALLICGRQPEATKLLDSLGLDAVALRARQNRRIASEPPYDEQVFNFRDDLKPAMRYLKKVFAQNTFFPNPLTIYNFMAYYLASGRSEGLQILAHRAFRCNSAIVNSMLLGEMLLYRRMDLPHLIIETFVDHYYLHDVPEKKVLKLYHLSKARAEQDPTHQRRVLNPTPKVVTRKLYPLSGHFILVWEVLLKGSVHADHLTNRAQLKALYDELIRNISDRKPRLGRDDPRTQITSSSFTAFIRPMMKFFGPPAGKKIMDEMLDLGIVPELRVYTEIAGQWARHGTADKVFDFIHHIELGGKFRWRGKDFPLPKPDLLFYVNVLRGFLYNNNAACAKTVVQHIQRAFPEADSQSYLDALTDLTNLEINSTDWVPIKRGRYAKV